MYLYVYIQYATIYTKIKFKIVCFSMGVHMYIFPDFYGKLSKISVGRLCAPCFLASRSFGVGQNGPGFA